jgi:hypothetical protein
MHRLASIGFLAILVACSPEAPRNRVSVLLKTTGVQEVGQPTTKRLVSAEAQAYVTDAIVSLAVYRTWLGKLDKQCDKASTDPSVVMGDTWKAQTAAAITALRTNAAEMDTLDLGRSEATALDRILRRIIQENALMTTEYTTGADDFDADLIASAAHRRWKIGVWLNEADREIARIR